MGIGVEGPIERIPEVGISTRRSCWEELPAVREDLAKRRVVEGPALVDSSVPDVPDMEDPAGHQLFFDHQVILEDIRLR